MFDISGLLPILQVAADNVTQSLQGISIPATITPQWQVPPTPTAQAVGADPLGVVGLISLAISSFNTWQNKNTNKQTNALANTQLDIVNSQKQTDMGVRDLSMGVNAGFQKLAQNDVNASLLNSTAGELKGATVLEWIKNQKEGWDSDIRAYYQDTMPKPGEFSKDPVIAKTQAVKKMTEPT